MLLQVNQTSFSNNEATITGISDEGIMELNLPTGIPFVYELDENMKPVKTMQFLGDAETVKKAMEAVAAQGKSKAKVAGNKRMCNC